MPENVAELLTVKELRDLSDYLMSLDSAAQCDPRYRDEDSPETSSFVVSVGLNRNVPSRAEPLHLGEQGHLSH
jgi:hypothetical protein